MDTERGFVKFFSPQAEAVWQAVENEGTAFSRREYVIKKYEESAGVFLAAYDAYVRALQHFLPEGRVEVAGAAVHKRGRQTDAVWGVLMAALAAAMMLGSGNGLSMLQTLSIVAAFPFAFIMVISMAALVKALRKENEE